MPLDAAGGPIGGIPRPRVAAPRAPSLGFQHASTESDVARLRFELREIDLTRYGRIQRREANVARMATATAVERAASGERTTIFVCQWPSEPIEG